MGEPLPMFLSLGANQQLTVEGSRSEAVKVGEMARVRRLLWGSVPAASAASAIICSSSWSPMGHEMFIVAHL